MGHRPSRLQRDIWKSFIIVLQFKPKGRMINVCKNWIFTSLNRHTKIWTFSVTKPLWKAHLVSNLQPTEKMKRCQIRNNVSSLSPSHLKHNQPVKGTTVLEWRSSVVSRKLYLNLCLNMSSECSWSSSQVTKQNLMLPKVSRTLNCN